MKEKDSIKNRAPIKLPETKKLSFLKVLQFQTHIWNTYTKHKRGLLPWRQTKDPYQILVSEIMLQQTQVERVLQKYKEFIERFPTLTSLAEAPQSEVLQIWQGLGYNRRALFLKKTAEKIVQVHKGIFPRTPEELLRLPGIGQSTAGALMNFAFFTPYPFIETNIRSVFLDYFFKKSSSVSDIQILPLINQTLDYKRPRDWFYALYDYGTILKKTLGKKKTVLHKKSAHYTIQSKFSGSYRQVRGAVLRSLLKQQKIAPLGLTVEDLQGRYLELQKLPTEKIKQALNSLHEEGFVSKTKKDSLFAIL
jgi:A/G-specific adenine glycosylase